MMFAAALGLFFPTVGTRSAMAQVNASQVEIEDGAHAVLNIGNFVRIRDFILAQGGRMTYTNRYNDNPYFAFGDLAFYLNPEGRNINSEPGKSEFNTIVVRTSRGSGGVQYRQIKLDRARGRLILVQYEGGVESAVLTGACAEYFSAAFAKIEQAGSRPPAVKP